VRLCCGCVADVLWCCACPQALKLQHPDGHLSLLLQLDVASGNLEALLTRQGWPCRAPK
jgi:hypothetical protein